MVHIRNAGRLDVPEGAEAILAAMFPEYQEVLLKEDFSAIGYSGSWVYRLHLLRENNAPELPVVVKVASASLIEKEWQAYHNCVRHQWPNVAELREEPVFLPGTPLAGLCYPLMGGDVFELTSLHDYCLQARIDDIRFVLEERLFQIIQKRMLHPSRNYFEFSWQASYDTILPVNLLLEAVPAFPPDGPPPTLITPNQLPPPSLQPGSPVQVEGFVITKVDLRRQTITLNLPAGGCSLRLRAVEGLTAYRIGQLIPPMAGVVAETRQGRLGEELRRALGTTFDPTVEAVTLPGMALLPNPLPAIPTILNQTRHAKVNCIHGDLNLENILVDTQIRDVRLIDFAEARRDHVLHDFLRLETEVITKIVPVILREAKLSPTLIYPLYQQLHCVAAHPEPSYPPALEKPLAILTTIRQAVRGGLYDPDDWSEYDQGLLLYLLGALKFNNLDEIPEAKRIAFWGAATIHHLLQATAPCPDLAQLWRQGADSPVSRSTGVTVKLDEDPVSEQMVGKTLADRYQIAQLLDKGGMGVVFRGQDILLQREVAVKVMHPYLAQDPLSRRRFLREAQAMARLNHQGIVRVFDFGQAGTLLYIVMELIVGKALSHRLQELRQAGQNGVALSEAIELIRQICLAIHCAHQQGVVHRDFKPGNIMLKAESGENLPYRPVITDFGLAKLLLDDEAAITQSGHLVGGTPAYMSPEQVRGQPSDARSDIYALGILLYELVTGELPFPINSVAGALYFHTQGVPPSPRSLRPNLPPVVEQVILRAIAKDPTQRFPDTLTMAQALTAETPAPMQPAPPPEVVTDKPEPPTRAASSQRFVAHQEKVGGDKITIGSISGHNVAIGRQSRITSIGGGGEADDLGRLFDTIYQFIANRPEDPNVDKEELLATVRQIQAEIAKGHEVNDTKIKRWLNYLAGMAPDVSKTTRQLLLTAPSVPPAIRLLAAGTGEKG